MLMRLWREKGGQNLGEYALLIVVISLLVGATFPALVALLCAQFIQPIP